MSTPTKAQLQQAAHWFVILQDDNSDSTTWQSWQQWLQACPQHQDAWERVQQISQRFKSVPSELALPVLSRPVSPNRRAVLRSLAGLTIMTTAGTASLRAVPWQKWQADLSTRVGEQQQYTLADNTIVRLNTDTAVDVMCEQGQRQLYLRQGEIHIQTAFQPNTPELIVRTQHGQVVSKNATFLVRHTAEYSLVHVLRQSLSVCLARLPSQYEHFPEGSQLRFDEQQLYADGIAFMQQADWLNGQLSVLNLPLHDFLIELSRYRRGYLSCTREIANLLVSGVYSVRDTDQSLAVLSRAFGLKQLRYSPFWVRLSAQNT